MAGCAVFAAAAAAGVRAASAFGVGGAAAGDAAGDGVRPACPSPPGIDSLPLLAATVSLVITGDFDAPRFVRFASATSGESSAAATKATPETRREAMAMRIIGSW